MEPESNIYLGTVGLGNGRLKGSLVFSPALLKKGAEYLIRYVIDPEKTNLEVGSDTLHSKLKARIKKEILDPLVRELSQPTKEGEQLIKMGGQNEEVEEPSEDLKDLEQLTPEPADLGVVEEEEVKGGASEESRPSGYRELKLGELTDDEYGLAEGCAGDVLDYAKYDLDISFSVQEGNKTRDDLTQLIAFERQYNPGGPVAEIIQKEDRHLSEENCAVIWKFYQGEEGVTSSADSSSQEDEDLSGEEIGAGDAPEQPAGEDKSSVEVPAAPPSADALADLAAKFGRGGSSGEGKKSSKKKKKKK
jgi:hypothetical protein